MPSVTGLPPESALSFEEVALVPPINLLTRAKMRLKLLLLPAFLPFLLVICDRAVPPKKLSWSQELQAVLDAGLKTTGGTGVSAAVIVTGEGEWAGVGGMSDPKTAKPIQPDMLFDIASVGKTFTAALVLQLVEEGRLSLEDSIHEWLPEFPNINSNVTIRQLLNHTSGISHFAGNREYWHTVFADPGRMWSPEEILAFVPEPRFPPGGGWHYSSTNYILLGMIIEKVTASTLSQQLRNRLLVPLNLDNTCVSMDGHQGGSRVFAHGHYDLNGDRRLDDMGSLSRNSLFSSAWAAGPVVSTAEDVARWAKILYGDRILPKELFDQMIDFHRPTPGEPFSSGYGLGTTEIKGEYFGGERVWGHLGWQPGFMTAMLYFPNHSVSVAVLINDNNENSITTIAVGLWNVVKNHLEGSGQR
jgi:D-alanyl-D-alanine carboxypeptidase